MDSGLIGANEFPKKNKWGDNCKVYTRKVFRNGKNNNNSKSETRTAFSGLKNVSCGDTEGEISEKLVVEVNNGDEKRVVNGTGNSCVEKINESVVVEELPVVTEQNVEKSNEDIVVVDVPMNENVVEEVPRVENRVKIIRHVKVSNNVNNENVIVEELPVEEAILSKTPEKGSVIETVTLSEDSGEDRVEEVLPNGHDYSNYDGNMGSGVVRDERRLVTQIDDRLNISVSAAKSREEVRDLKRKLEDELLQVRRMARKLETKESQISSVDFDGGSGRVHDVPAGVNRMHVVPFNGGMNNGFNRTQEVGSASYIHPRGYGGERSVPVMDNSYYGGSENFHEKEKRTPKANKYYPHSEFVLGKEKLPTGESSRKAKSGGGVGKKNGGRELNLGFGFDKKIHKKCSELLQKLQKHKHGWVFNQPVDVDRLGLHDYYDIIRHPMDLGTVKTRLTNNWYKTPREFAEDVRLTFHNAMTYNPEGQDVHIMAKELLRIFNEKWPAIDADFERRLRYEMFRSEAGTPTPTSRKSVPFAPARAPIHMPLPPPPLLHHPPPPPFQEIRNLDRSQSMPVRSEPRPKPTPSIRTPALKKPKAKDLNKRDMTFEEKQKLSTSLQGLPSEKLDVIVQIIRKRNTALQQHDDEIEVDIDSVDTETLWELDRFVTNHKKSQSKKKRKFEIAQQAREAARVAAEDAAAAAAAATPQQAVSDNVPIAPAYVEPTREDNNRADEVNVAAPPPHVQEERHSDSSGSSSSSSGSGSSSSDSDSSSSSDSGSDQER